MYFPWKTPLKSQRKILLIKYLWNNFTRRPHELQPFGIPAGHGCYVFPSQTEVGLKGTYSHVTSRSLRNLHKPQFHTPTVWAVRITKDVWQGWSRRTPVRVSQRICYLQTLNICQPMKAFPHSLVRQQSACNAGDPGSIPGSGRSPGMGDGNPLQCSCLENPTDRGAWRATVHGVAKSDTTARRGTHAAVTALRFSAHANHDRTTTDSATTCTLAAG